MLKTPLYSFLSVCQCEHFSNKLSQIAQVKEGLVKYLKIEKQDILEALKIKDCFCGWKHVINDMALNNELADVRAINIPNLKSKVVERQDWYTFADFLPSGYHQILIYDPLLERAFAKDFVIKLNQRDFVYPEYPLPQTENTGKQIQDMWRNWVGYQKQVLDQI